MRSTFTLAALLGFAGVLIGSYFAPWAAHERVASRTSVAINGGRRETFMIHLPADRIIEVADAERLPSTTPATIVAPHELASAPLVAEHFKLRDVDGTVIGLAARHWSSTPDGSASVWILSIPSRGTLVLAADGDVPGRLAGALAAVSTEPGSTWSAELELAVTDPAARVVTGTDEFSSVRGSYAETWRLSGVDDRRALRGTIVLDTIVNQAS